MKFTIQKSELTKYIGIAQRAISNRSSIQILEGIVFETRGNELILSSTDLELSVNTRVACDVQEEGSLVLKSEIVGNIVRKMPNDLITFNGNAESVKITCQNSKFDLKAQDSMDYPSLPDPVDEVTLTMDAIELKEALHETIFATSIDETWLALTGVLFSQKSDCLEFVGLDGYRMAIKKFDYRSTENETIIPKRALNELSKIIEDGKVDITMAKGHVIFTTGNTKMYTRVIDKKYIDYEKIVSTNNKIKLTVNRDDLLSSLERASLLASGGEISLSKFSISDGVINIHSKSELGEIEENISCQQIGDDINISFNTRYVIEGIKAINDDKLTIYLNEPLNPMIIHPFSDENSYLYLVLPVRTSA